MDSYDNDWIFMLDDDLFPVEESDIKNENKKSGDMYYPHSQTNPDAVCIFPAKH